ncbi:MAG: glucose-6-phosphate dehydrogenase [Planctomycetota bacterium]
MMTDPVSYKHTAVLDGAAASRAEPCAIVIFGASGDLARRKLIPALYNLALARQLPPGFAVVGFGRTEKTDAAFREEMLAAVNEFSRQRPADPAVWKTFADSLVYHVADYDDPAGYRRLAERLSAHDRERGTGGNRLFYLATPPATFPVIIENIGAAGFTGDGPDSPGWERILVEKPFGSDLDSARDLNRRILNGFPEPFIFRIDHYLGKETVQNIIVARFANTIFEPLFNHRHVDHVQITVAETVGVESRARYFDSIGILRDMVQNHMLQLLALVAMEPPVSLAAEAIRDEKLKVLKALRPMTPADVRECVVRGQYAPGVIGAGNVSGYRGEKDVPPDSRMETFAALKLFIDNWRWAGVPFYLRAGKRLPRKVTEVTVVFKDVPRILFNKREDKPLEPNTLHLHIQPDEGMRLRFCVKVPGTETEVRGANMDFTYGTSFGKEPPEAYERLLLDAMRGDATLFTRVDEVDAAWQFVTPILRAWEAAPPPEFPNYAAGTPGPREAEELLGRDGRKWVKHGNTE